jgi:hypothetical protein
VPVIQEPRLIQKDDTMTRFLCVVSNAAMELLCSHTHGSGGMPTHAIRNIELRDF